jgi:hypothetical protein
MTNYLQPGRTECRYGERYEEDSEERALDYVACPFLPPWFSPMMGSACVTYAFRLRLTFILSERDLAALMTIASLNPSLPS